MHAERLCLLCRLPRMVLVDCHAHVCDEQFENDLDNVLQQARESGPRAIIAVSETLYECHKSLRISKIYPRLVYACAGMHPEKANLIELPDVIQFIRTHRNQLIGIGECGLDYTPKVLGNNIESVKAIQKEVFNKQAALAVELDLPLNVHSRCAGHHAITALKEAGVKKAVLHAFDGKAKYALAAATTHGYYFSIPPSIVRSSQKNKLVETLPIENLLLETDSPALGPVPNIRNVPCNAKIACEAIAAIKRLSVEEVSRITTKNAVTLFGLPCLNEDSPM
eukprot:CFRG6058T1